MCTKSAQNLTGEFIGYGNDANLIHQPDGETHDDWWSAMSMAGVLNMLEQSYRNGTATSPVFTSATKHWDSIYVSTYYNWQPGTWKDVYTHVGMYKLKASSPDDAMDTLAKTISFRCWKNCWPTAPFTSTNSIPKHHTHAPDTFSIIYIAANAEAWTK